MRTIRSLEMQAQINLTEMEQLLKAASNETEPVMHPGQPKLNLAIGQNGSPQNDGMMGGAFWL
ncbi:MAG: hypothetical protein NTZ74_10255 [Chloroflexi bacterium]|nr:hypothetical protein [Chloroflexota bacterium]